jgi:hypothetical protein
MNVGWKTRRRGLNAGTDCLPEGEEKEKGESRLTLAFQMSDKL